MRLLIAEDDRVSRRLLTARLEEWGYRVEACEDGNAAWAGLGDATEPYLAILDWQMPGLDGVDICRRVRAQAGRPPTYLILLTTMGNATDIVTGLEAGADDYVVKPFEAAELRARVRVGLRVLDLQIGLADRVRELEDALARVQLLQRLLPICMYCKKIRDDQDYWHQVEAYVGEHAGAQFSHGICPDCYERVIQPQIDEAARGK